MIDGFEDNDIAEYGGYTTNATVQTTTVRSGSYALQHDTDGGGKHCIGSTTGLSNYPQAGDTFYYHFYVNAGGNVIICGFASQGEAFSGTNQINPDTGGYCIEVRNGQRIDLHIDSTRLATTSMGSLTTGWNELEIQWGSGGSITATLFDPSGTKVASVSATDTTYSSGGIHVGQDNHNSNANTIYFDDIHHDAPPAPSSVTLTVNADDSIGTSWSNVRTEENYRIQISRDGAAYTNPSGGPTTTGVDSTSATYNPNSDNSYNSQVGIDSAFQFRVRAENFGGNSAWTTSATTYTTPVPPKNPSVNRPDGNTIDVSWVSNTNLGTSARTDIEYRKDTGTGYGAWSNAETISASAKGTAVTRTYSVATDAWMAEDARYQFRVAHYHYTDWDNSGATELHESPYVYADYGNRNNVFFEDRFEDPFAEYAGQTGAFALKAEQGPYSGSHHVESAGTANSHEGIYNTTVSLDTTVNQTITGWVYTDGATGINGGIVCLDDTGAGYAAYIEPGNGDFLLGKISGTTTWQTTLSEDTAVSYSAGWYQLELVVGSGGSHTATLYDSSGTQVTSLSASDTAYSPFHPGVWAYDNGLKLDLLKWNDGTTIGSDDFEYLGLSEWDAMSFTSGSSSGVADTAFVDPNASDRGPESTASGRTMGISGPAEGSYYLFLEDGDTATKNLGDLSAESDVLVKCYIATNSMDSGSEHVDIDWYDGAAWQNLEQFYWEYNRQGWIEVTSLVPSSYLSTDNRLRFNGWGGSGDYMFVDRVIVSDILHEYTTPAGATSFALDTSIEDEITASWTNNHSFPYSIDVYYKRSSNTTYTKNALSGTATSYTWTGLDDGEEYDIYQRVYRAQDRHGSKTTGWVNATAVNSGITVLPAPTTLTADTINSSSIDISWTPNHDYGNIRVETKPTDVTTWTNQSGALSKTSSSYLITGLRNGEKYDIRVVAYTEHTESIDA